MFRGILATLGVGAVVAGSSSTVLASPTILSQPDTDFSTHDADSLRNLENRNVSKDYRTLIASNISLPESSPVLLSEKSSPPIIEIPPEILALVKRVEISTGGSSLDSDQLVRVQVHLE